LKNKKQFILGYNYNYAFNGSINIASKIDFDNEDTATMKINKLSKNNFVIFDNDNLSVENVNYKKIKKLKKKLGKRCNVVAKLKTIENIIPPIILKEFYNANYKPRDKKLKTIVLAFFEEIMTKYGTDSYSEMDIADEMAIYIDEHVDNKDTEGYRKRCKNLWKSNKYNLAIYFANRVKDMTEEEKKHIYDETIQGFTEMIQEIYKFINENN
jgi:hypothetical protein